MNKVRLRVLHREPLPIDHFVHSPHRFSGRAPTVEMNKVPRILTCSQWPFATSVRAVHSPHRPPSQGESQLAKCCKEGDESDKTESKQVALFPVKSFRDYLLQNTHRTRHVFWSVDRAIHIGGYIRHAGTRSNGRIINLHLLALSANGGA